MDIDEDIEQYEGVQKTVSLCGPLSLSLYILPVAYCGLMLCRGLRSISALTNLRHLNLSDTAITDHSVCSLSRMRRLKYLNLSHSGALQTLT